MPFFFFFLITYSIIQQCYIQLKSFLLILMLILITPKHRTGFYHKILELKAMFWHFKFNPSIIKISLLFAFTVIKNFFPCFGNHVLVRDKPDECGKCPIYLYLHAEHQDRSLQCCAQEKEKRQFYGLLYITFSYFHCQICFMHSMNKA